VSEHPQKIRVGISLGDINGIGIEVIVKTLLDKEMLEFCTPIAYGSTKVTSYHRKVLGINDWAFNGIKKVEDANPKLANMVQIWDEEVPMLLGQSTKEGGKYALLSLQAAVADLKAGKLDVLVTAPINKNNIQSDEFRFQGHTEFLANAFDCKDYMMLLVSDNLKVGLVSGHVPISTVAQIITQEKINSKLRIMNQSLIKDFGIRKPKIAVLGLNPHAGDNGTIGKEEKDIIIPAINRAYNEQIMAFGPYSSDGFFGSGQYRQFDAVLAMYHDQGLTPFKSMAFDYGVNYTAGLPIVRTSPDHGTGYDIAGKNKASEHSFRQSIFMAIDIFNQRNGHEAINANPLKISKLKREYER
jgi:4-hydroxythreonine-4-phosphate dehydrogenase